MKARMRTGFHDNVVIHLTHAHTAGPIDSLTKVLPFQALPEASKHVTAMMLVKNQRLPVALENFA